MSFQSVDQALAHLHTNGLFYPDATQGFQYDIVASFRPTADGQITQSSLCGFNCTKKKGGYNCPAAATLNVGVSKSTFAPAGFILDKCDTVEAGLDEVREWFLKNRFESFCNEFEIADPMVREAIRRAFAAKKTEANLFGGDSEQHPQIIQIVRALKSRGMKINLTATGGRWVTDQGYVDELLADPPQVVCVSLDDMGVVEFNRYVQMSQSELKLALKAMDQKDAEGKSDWDYGQRKKALAGFYVARYLTDLPGGPPTLLLFNTVLTPSNICRIGEITHLAQHAFPGSIVNPYPGQGSFLYEEPEVNRDYLQGLNRFVDGAIQKTLAGDRFVKRLHYWLILKAVFDDYLSRDDWDGLARALSGYGVWKCYQEAMAGFYVQPSRSEVPVSPLSVKLGKVVRREDVEGVPGAYLGCYWNPHTVTETEQIRSAGQVSRHILLGMQELAAKSDKACGGSLMPRLMFNYASSMLGLNPALRPAVTKLRKQYAGF